MVSKSCYFDKGFYRNQYEIKYLYNKNYYFNLNGPCYILIKNNSNIVDLKDYNYYGVIKLSTFIEYIKLEYDLK